MVDRPRTKGAIRLGAEIAPNRAAISNIIARSGWQSKVERAIDPVWDRP